MGGSEKDVSGRKCGGEKEKRRMSLQHVGWSEKQWRRTALETIPVQLF
jgi:hypothetical protein